MYQRIDPPPHILMDNGEHAEPVAMLADEYGGRAAVIVDDGCYVLCLYRSTFDNYRMTPWIFREAHEVLSALPPPSK